MSPITVRPASRADIEVVVEITAASFPEEVSGSGIPGGKWRELEQEELARSPDVWPQIGARSPLGAL